MFQAKLLKFDTPLSTEEVMIAISDFHGWWTRAEIAHRLGCAKSPTLIKIINQCVSEGLLYWTVEAMPNGVDCYYYIDANHLPPSWVNDPKTGRATELPF